MLSDIGGLQIKTYPLQPNNTSQYMTEDGNKFAKQKHKQDLTHKQQQLLDSFKPTDKRHSAKRRESLIQFFEVFVYFFVENSFVTRYFYLLFSCIYIFLLILV